MTMGQVVAGARVVTRDGPGTVVAVEQSRYRTTFGRWFRHAWVLVELKCGQRRRYPPSEVTTYD